VHHHVLHADDVGMPYAGGKPCLEQAVRVRLVDLLDGDGAVQQLVLGAPHSRHGAPADQLCQPVAAGQEHPGGSIGDPQGRLRR